MSLPPCIELPLQHLRSMSWEDKPRFEKDFVKVHGAKNPYGPLDTLRVTATFEGIAPQTVMCVYEWNTADMTDLTAPMNVIDDMRVQMNHFGPATDVENNATIAKLIDERGREKFTAQDLSHPSWTAAKDLPPSSPTEQIFQSVGKSPMMLVKPRDFAMRKENPIHLTEAQRKEFGFTGDTWVTGSLPYGGLPKLSGHERAVTHRFAAIAEALPNGAGTTLTIVVAFDMAGSLPAMVVNTASGRMGETAFKVFEQAKRIRAENGGEELTPAEYHKKRLALKNK